MAIQLLKDEYEILDEIGAGGMATVFKARQKSLDRLVAIKQLKKSYHADAQIVRRFERESRVAASLQHENIVHIYDYWKRPHFAIVMEYVDGVDLAGIIEKTGPLPVDVGVMIAIQVCNALDYAHMRGLVHRDIKPSNIMIKRNGEVKLMDFGIAYTRHMDALTMPGTLIGTPAYMSPEQILGQPLDIRSDLFSFGIVLYEMFTGVKPFFDEETRPVSAKILKDDIVSPRRVNRDIPRPLQRIIGKCLRKKSKRRFGSMPDVGKKLVKRLKSGTTKPESLHRIADYLVSRNVFEAAPEQETMVITGSRAGLSPRMSWAIAGALLLLLAAGGAGYYSRTMTNPRNNQMSPSPEQRPTAPAASSPTTTPVTAPSASLASQSTATAPAAASPRAGEQKSGSATGKKPPASVKKRKRPPANSH